MATLATLDSVEVCCCVENDYVYTIMTVLVIRFFGNNISGHRCYIDYNSLY